MIGKVYTDKIPKPVREAMRLVSADDCYLIKRRVKGVTGNGKELDCHQNVQDLVERIGGERISGWLLIRRSDLFRNGIYLWMFHSIWKSPEGECVDVTQSSVYGNDKIATFWHDTGRKADLAEGTAYNSLVTLQNDDAAQIMMRDLDTSLAVGVPYWVAGKFRHFCKLDDHSGVFRMLHPDYPKNAKLLEEQYDCRSERGRIITNKEGAKLSTMALFDFSLG